MTILSAQRVYNIIHVYDPSVYKSKHIITLVIVIITLDFGLQNHFRSSTCTLGEHGEPSLPIVLLFLPMLVGEARDTSGDQSSPFA